MDGLRLESVDEDGIDDLVRTIHEGFDAIPRPPGIEAYRSTPFASSLRDERGDIVGAITGHSVWGWLYVNYLWITETRRSQGLGTRLLDAAEAEAEKRGCSGVWLNTVSFQAPAFYESRGYTSFGEIEDFPRGHKRVFYKKHLTPVRTTTPRSDDNAEAG